jgi:Xaa-Pro aminopeptidase
MKSDIDALMQSCNLDAIFVTGPGQNNPPMVYLTGGAHLTSAELIQMRGQPPVLFHAPMERGEAAATGLALKNINDYNPNELFKAARGDALQATVERYRLMLAELGLTHGRVGLYGRADVGAAFAVFSSLKSIFPDLEFIGQMNESVLADAMATKNSAEVERIRRMGKITTEVVGLTADFITSQRVKDDTLVKSNGSPLTIGEVKGKINLWLSERGADNPEGSIFAIGADAGLPHSTGKASDPLRLGRTIVYDIFPCEAGGGYHYDFTRTWCLGYATDEAQALYEDVLAVYKTMMNEIRAGVPTRNFQLRACELFETRGHPTILSDPQTQEGYVHSLGHGLGLQVHERPSMRQSSPESEVLVPGHVVTVEPGLYYPERGLGVRIEDTVFICPDGKPELLAEYPLDLVLPMKA